MSKVIQLLLLSLSGLSIQAQGADIFIEPIAGYAKVITVDEALKGCSWNAEVAPVVIKKAKKRIPVLSPEATMGIRLKLQVVALGFPVQGHHELDATLRADVFNESGKLVASHDFYNESRASSIQDACPALKKFANSVGEDIADWLDDTYLPECTGTCPGIHPDQPIVVVRDIPPSEPDAMNDEIVNECKWPTYMSGLVVDAFNGLDDRPLAAVVLAKDNGPVNTGRRLVLHVDNIHVIGGGGFTGPKWIAMHGELYDGDLQVASFEVTKLGGGLGWAGLRTCSALRSKSEDLAENIAKWLRDPKMKEKL